MAITPPNSSDKQQILIISSNPKINEMRFSPYDFKFVDSFKPEFNSYEAFGRMDPIMIYKKTSRDVSLSFKVVAENEGDAEKNFKMLNNLIQSIYPTYQTLEVGAPQSSAKAESTITSAQQIQDSYIKSSPLLRIKFMNLLTNDAFLAAVTNFNYEMDFENGSYTSLNKNGVATPGKISYTINFKVLHTYLPGTKNVYNIK